MVRMRIAFCGGDAVELLIAQILSSIVARHGLHQFVRTDTCPFFGRVVAFETGRFGGIIEGKKVCTSKGTGSTFASCK